MASVNKQRVQRRFERAFPHYQHHATAQQQINHQLLNMLAQQDQRRFNKVLEIGCGTGHLSQLLYQHYQSEQWIFNDLCPIALSQLQTQLGSQAHYWQGDAEQLDYQHMEKIDLLVSASTVQWFHQPQRIIDIAQHCLTPQGLLLFSTFLPDNLTEIKQLTGVGLTYPTKSQWLNWLAADFTLLNMMDDPIRLYFEQPKQVLTHLKQTGVTATSTTPWTKGKLNAFIQSYQQQFSQNNQVYLTYAPLLILAKGK